MEKQDSSKDLEGLLVVTIEQAVAAPYTSCRLADAGARVIKVERPEGDFARNYDSNALGNSAYFVWLNRGKESISLEKEVVQLRLAYITTKSDLMRMYRRSIIEDLVVDEDLYTSLDPPIIIDIINE